MHPCLSGDFSHDDTALCLDCFGNGYVPDDGCKLVLGLGPTPAGGSGNYAFRSSTGKRTVTTAPDSLLKLGISADDDTVSNLIELSGSIHGGFEQSECEKDTAFVTDEGSTSAKKSGGYITTLILAPRMGSSDIQHSLQQSNFSEPDFGNSTVSSSHKGSTIKKCRFSNCTKGARGASGLCIGHGGGQRCQKPGCNKGAESRTAYCKAHGGGRRCQSLGCTKSAEGKTDLCISHGGGRRCSFPGGCTKAARGKSGLCIRHGGGKRCSIEGCTRSAEGQIGLCISHGGGRRCQFIGCNKGAQGSTLFCKAHGGGKRCVFTGCNKGAEGSTHLCKGHGGGKRCLYDGGGICPKSVHGGTDYCVAHGGGKRCTVPGCTKSARGRTDCCVKHGGGKRCKFENCGKSAQGSTEFCKAHGGGKRCKWGDGKCERFARGKSGLCAAHMSMVPAQGSMIGPGLFHGLVPASSSSSLSAVSDQRQSLIPPQVLVPLSMKASAVQENVGDADGAAEFSLPEGRVHGGGLLSLLRGNI